MKAAGSTSPGRIAAAFETARREGRAALIPYFTAGDPDLEASLKVAGALQRGGADIVELGVPFSDPTADGPVNQRAAERALRNGVTLKAVLDLAAELRRDGGPPLVLFTYYNPVHRLGLDRFVGAVVRAGLDGVLVTDLPLEEAGDLGAALLLRRIDLIRMVAPTSSQERVEGIARAGRGFLYVIARTGTTGAREDLPAALEGQVRAARAAARIPVAVGFGIARPEQVHRIAAFADGVVVGSALVRLIEEASGAADLPARVEAFCREMRAAGARA